MDGSYPGWPGLRPQASAMFDANRNGKRSHSRLSNRPDAGAGGGGGRTAAGAEGRGAEGRGARGGGGGACTSTHTPFAAAGEPVARAATGLHSRDGTAAGGGGEEEGRFWCSRARSGAAAPPPSSAAATPPADTRCGSAEPGSVARGGAASVAAPPSPPSPPSSSSSMTRWFPSRFFGASHSTRTSSRGIHSASPSSLSRAWVSLGAGGGRPKRASGGAPPATATTRAPIQPTGWPRNTRRRRPTSEAYAGDSAHAGPAAPNAGGSPGVGSDLGREERGGAVPAGVTYAGEVWRQTKDEHTRRRIVASMLLRLGLHLRVW